MLLNSHKYWVCEGANQWPHGESYYGTLPYDNTKSAYIIQMPITMTPIVHLHSYGIEANLSVPWFAYYKYGYMECRFHVYEGNTRKTGTIGNIWINAVVIGKS